MAVIYRRLQRVSFQAASISASKWTCSKPPVQHVRSYLSTKVPTCFKEANPKKLGHQESSVAYNTAMYVNGTEENRVGSFDNADPIDLKQLLDHQKPHSTRVNYKDIEYFSTMRGPRVFQQHRPEYKSMCYNSERPMKISVEEGNAIMEKVTDCLTPSEVSEFLVKLSCLPRENMRLIKLDDKFKTLCSHRTSDLHLYTKPQLIDCLDALVCLKISKSNPMLRKYEQEFFLRVRKLSINELLLAADMFRYIGCEVPNFLDAMYSSMQRCCATLSLPQIIQLVYIIGEARRAPLELLVKIDNELLKYLKDINTEEIGIVCLGFFKTSNGLSNRIMSKFGEIIANNIEQLSNFSLVNVLKMTRFTREGSMPFLRQLSQDAYKRIPTMGMQSIMHVVLTFASMHVLDEDLMDAVALAVPDRVHHCRSKDLAKFLWSFGILGFKPPNADVFYSSFISQIRNIRDEFEQYPEHFLTCLIGLAFCQQFPFDLINIALSDNFVIKSANHSIFSLKKDLLTIANAVEIECPQYTGNMISPEFRKEVTNLLVEQSTQEIYTRKEVITARLLLPQVLGGPEYVKEHMILPHVRSKDLEVHLDANRKPIAIKPVTDGHDQPFSGCNNIRITDYLLNRLTNVPANSKNSGIENPGNLNIVEGLSVTTCPEKKSEKSTGQSEVVKLAIQVTNRNNYLYNSQQLLGLHAMKRRHLHKLGYVVVEVPFWEWFPLVKYDLRSKQLDYLHHKIFSAV